MQEQNYKNHSKLVPTFHLLTGPAIVALIIGAVRNIYKGDGPADLYNATLILLVALILLSLYIHTRLFATKVQDRAIRAEEALRHFALTGKRLDPRLRMSQIIALRFASDEEFPALAQKAAEQALSNKQIKKEIRAWRADHYRV